MSIVKFFKALWLYFCAFFGVWLGWVNPVEPVEPEETNLKEEIEETEEIIHLAPEDPVLLEGTGTKDRWVDRERFIASYKTSNGIEHLHKTWKNNWVMEVNHKYWLVPEAAARKFMIENNLIESLKEHFGELMFGSKDEV